jgi:hypothetical protein
VPGRYTNKHSTGDDKWARQDFKQSHSLRLQTHATAQDGTEKAVEYDNVVLVLDFTDDVMGWNTWEIPLIDLCGALFFPRCTGEKT